MLDELHVSSSFCFQAFNKMCRYLALVCLSFALLAVSKHVYFFVIIIEVIRGILAFAVRFYLVFEFLGC